MPQIRTTTGAVTFVGAWLAFVYLGARSTACLRFNSCTGDDLLLAMIVGTGMLIPAWILGALVSAMFGASGQD